MGLDMSSRNRGRPKQKIRDLSRQWPSDSEQRAAFDEVVKDGSSPITIAILGASLVEFELEKILREKFHHKDDETWKEITSAEGPLSGFYAKIVAGYAFGLYGLQFRETLHTLRAIRNAFAHSKKLVNFQNGLILGELRKLSKLDSSKSKNSKLSRGLKDVSRIASEPNPDGRSAFVILIFIISNHFLRYTNKSMQKKLDAARRRLKRLRSLAKDNLGFENSYTPLARGLLSYSAKAPGKKKD
jgi:hypothetical protein